MKKLPKFNLFLMPYIIRNTDCQESWVVISANTIGVEMKFFLITSTGHRFVLSTAKIKNLF